MASALSCKGYHALLRTSIGRLYSVVWFCVLHTKQWCNCVCRCVYYICIYFGKQPESMHCEKEAFVRTVSTRKDVVSVTGCLLWVYLCVSVSKFEQFWNRKHVSCSINKHISTMLECMAYKYGSMPTNCCILRTNILKDIICRMHYYTINTCMTDAQPLWIPTTFHSSPPSTICTQLKPFPFRNAAALQSVVLARSGWNWIINPHINTLHIINTIINERIVGNPVRLTVLWPSWWWRSIEMGFAIIRTAPTLLQQVSDVCCRIHVKRIFP